MVDIAVVVLDDNHYFKNFLPWETPKVTITQSITCFGLKSGSDGDNVSPFALPATINCIESKPGSALFQSTYYSLDGCSGAGIVTTLKNDIISVVGVHVASHEDSKHTVPIKGKKKRTLSDLEASVRSDFHGHSSYCLVCETARVPDLTEFLRNCK